VNRLPGEVTMNRSHNTSYVQIALILGALLAGTVMTKIVPERTPMAAYVPQTQVIPTTAVFKQARTRDASRDLTGIDVDMRRLAMFGQIC
jgi:hypothetical protein